MEAAQPPSAERQDASTGGRFGDAAKGLLTVLGKPKEGSCRSCALAKVMGFGCRTHGRPWDGVDAAGWPLRDSPDGV